MIYDVHGLKVEVVGLKSGCCAQYDVIIHSTPKIRGEVKRSSITIESDRVSMDEVIDFINHVCSYLDLIKELTVIPSDAGIVKELVIYFRKLNKSIHIPIR